MNSIIKKGLCIVLILTMILSSTAVVFAACPMVTSPDEVANAIQEICGVENVEIFKQDASTFSLCKNGLIVALPQDDNKGVMIKNFGSPEIAIDFPDNSTYKKGAMDPNGTIVYDAVSEDYSMVIQMIEQTYEGFSADELKTSIVIGNKNAPMEYTYEYDLPKDWSLISIDDYLQTQASEEEKNEFLEIEDAIFILNQAGEITHTIDELQAIDSQGNPVVSNYEVNGNSITQTIEFDENVEFPVVLYNTDHPDYNETKYFDEDEIKEIRDRYTNSSLDILVTGFGLYGISKLNAPVGTAYTFISIAVSAYDAYAYTTWNTFYETVHNSTLYFYLRAITRYHYHPGKRCYYPANCDYAYVKGIPV